MQQQQQEGWVGSASAPPLAASGPGQQGPVQGRIGPNGAPMRPNGQLGPRPMLQSPMMAGGESPVCPENVAQVLKAGTRCKYESVDIKAPFLYPATHIIALLLIVKGCPPVADQSAALNKDLNV